MGTFFKEQLHLKEPFQTFKSLTPLQHTTRTDRMKFLLPILLISLAALCNIQPAATTEPTAGTQDEAVIDEMLQVIEDGDMPEPDGDVPESDGEVPESDGDEPEADGDVPESDVTMRGASLRASRVTCSGLSSRQCKALAIARKFFKYADTNHTGQLTWSEFWTALVKIMRSRGQPTWKIKKYYPVYKKFFYKTAAKTGYKYLASMLDIKYVVKARVH